MRGGEGDADAGFGTEGAPHLGSGLCSGIAAPAEHEEHLEDVGRTSRAGKAHPREWEQNNGENRGVPLPLPVALRAA